MTRKAILVLEGLMGTGKTTLSRELAEELRKTSTVRVLGEGETLTPIRHETSPQAWNAHYLKVLEDIETAPEEVFILDRFHLTKFEPRNEGLFESLEERLRSHKTYVFLLTLPCDAIRERLKDTQEQRGPSWKLNSDGKSLDEEAARCCEIQGMLSDELRRSSIPSYEIGTLDKDWRGYVSEMLALSGLQSAG